MTFHGLLLWLFGIPAVGIAIAHLGAEIILALGIKVTG